METKLQVNIERYKPQIEAKPHIEKYIVHMNPDATVLDTLERIRTEQESGLMYRHSCHHSCCGTCAMIINGRERLACITKISAFESNTVTLQPLSGFPIVADLVVDMSSFHQNIDKNWDYLKPAENLGHRQLPQGIARFERFENCIECGCCISACPVTGLEKPFIGPAALAAMNMERKKTSSPQQIQALIEQAKLPQGEPSCERALACSRVCPTKVYPARHIAELRRQKIEP